MIATTTFMVCYLGTLGGQWCTGYGTHARAIDAWASEQASGGKPMLYQFSPQRTEPWGWQISGEGSEK